jgi:opacity protein-like surface antigen
VKRALYLATMLALLTLVVAAPAMAQGVATDQYAAAAQYQYGAAQAQYGAAALPPTGGVGLLPIVAGVVLLLGGLALQVRLQRR